MNGDDRSHFSANRKTGQQKSHGYSPSSNYNYNSSQTQHSSHSNGNFSGSGSKTHHRKPGGGSFKRDSHSHGGNDKLIKQNDIIIKLLKEIRDRLPEAKSEKKDKSISENDTEERNNTTLSETPYEQKNSETKDDTNDSIANVATVESEPVEKKTTVVKLTEDEELDRKVNGNI